MTPLITPTLPGEQSLEQNRWPFGTRADSTKAHRDAPGRRSLPPWLRTDYQAFLLKTTLERVTVPLAHAAVAFVDSKVWNDFGFARLDDHARERFKRSGRWLRDLATVGRALDMLPGLGTALSGDDGGRPIGVVASLLIARVATADSVSAWVEGARMFSIRALREQVRQARAAGSPWPPGMERDEESGRCGGVEASGHEEDSQQTGSGVEQPAVEHPVVEHPVAQHPVAEHPVVEPEARRSVVKTRRADPGSGGGEKDGTKGPVDEEDLGERRRIRFPAPPPISAAFDESLDLYRAVEGYQASATTFVDALIGEACAGLDPPGVECVRLPKHPTEARVEEMLALATDNWRGLTWRSPAVNDVDHRDLPSVKATQALATPAAGAGDSVAKGAADKLMDDVPAGQTSTGQDREKPDADGRIRWLLAVQDELERRLGRLLARMGDEGAWQHLRFAGLGHYAEQRLGWGRTPARERARLARGLKRLPRIREAYEEGRLGLSAALCLVRLLGHEPVDDHRQRKWVERAEQATVKRLRDEACLLRRRKIVELRERSATGSSVGDRSMGHRSVIERPVEAPVPRSVRASVSRSLGVPVPPSLGARIPRSVEAPVRRLVRASFPRPVDDATWHRSLRREVGTARERVYRLGKQAASGGWVDEMFSLSLPEELAGPFLSAIESARRRLAAVVRHEPETAGQPPVSAPKVRPDELERKAGSEERPSLLAARMFSTLGRPVPSWVGLLALLEDFVETWDVRHREQSASRDAVHIRDGWRCMAPGCMSRRNLQEHHLIYRSRGGCDDLANRVSLCEFHHQQGEHGGLASCRGMAPLGIRWSLGRGGRGGIFKNELRVKG
jgi:hypothetical protein